jgi:hypothetical protein
MYIFFVFKKDGITRSKVKKTNSESPAYFKTSN